MIFAYEGHIGALIEIAMPTIVENVVYQHAENVCFLWMQREQAVNEPHYSFKDLAHLDDRLEANIDGMRIAGIQGDPMLDEMIEMRDEGAHFGRALLALERGERDVFNALVSKADDEVAIQNELASALAWVAPVHLKETVKSLLESQNPIAFTLGYRACAAQGRNPGKYLGIGASHENAMVRACAYRTAADLADRQFYSEHPDIEMDNPEVRIEQARGHAMLGNRSMARSVLESMAASGGSRAAEATSLLMLISDSRSGRAFLKKLSSTPGRERDVISGFGLLGDPVAMVWLINKSREPEFARVCGGAITMITGIDLAYEDLDLADEPEGFTAGPDDDPANVDVALDEDENLPWPDPERIEQWWASSGGLAVGSLYLGGHRKEPDKLITVLRHGMQRQRNAAAQLLALQRPEIRFRDTRLPINKQTGWMS